jgi:hypothetical protein
VYALAFNGSTPALKNYAVSVSGDQYVDESGAVHQSDVFGSLKVTFKDLINVSIGPHNGNLRSYTTDAPGLAGCDDPTLIRTTYTGFPNYYCGETERFGLFKLGVGYRDGTQSPTDFAFSEGPFGGTYLHQYSLSASRTLGTRFSVAGQYAGTYGRTISDGTLSSQWLRLVSLGYNLGADSNVALELRAINGLVSGLTTVPGVNLAVSYHSRFANGNQLYLSFGTPSATQTLNRFIVKYVFHAGPQN